MGREYKKRGIAVAGTWVPLGLTFLRSRACAALSPHAAKLLLDLLALLGPNATKNGDLCITPKVMQVRGWSGRATLQATVTELEKHGLIVKAKQGGRLDCCLFAVTLYPLDCDLRKLDVGPGAYTSRDWEQAGLNPPTEEHPTTWRRARKTVSVAPPRYEVGKQRSATVRTAKTSQPKSGTLYRHGTKPHESELSSVPPRVTYLETPCRDERSEGTTDGKGSDQRTTKPSATPRRYRPGSDCAIVFEALATGTKTTADLKALGVARPPARVHELQKRGYAISREKAGKLSRYVLTAAPSAHQQRPEAEAAL